MSLKKNFHRSARHRRVDAVTPKIAPTPVGDWVRITGVDRARADLTPRDPDEFVSRKEVARHVRSPIYALCFSTAGPAMGKLPTPL